METWNGNRLDACLFTGPSPKDHRVMFSADLEVPRQVDFRAQCTPIENQGQIGSCTANACVGALEYLYAKRDGQAPDLSRMFVYYNTRRLKGTLQQDSGAAVSEAMAAVLAFGACRSELWPYNPGIFTDEPPAQAYTDGRAHEAIEYARVPGLGGAVQALSQGYPVVFGTFIPQRCYEAAAQTGIIPATTTAERQAQPSGGHCMLIVGYDLDRKILHIRNSWGAEWGNDGYCEFPFEEIAWSCPEDSFWMLVELEPKGEFSVSRSLYNYSRPPAMDTRSAKPATETGSTSVADITSDLRDQIRGDMLADIDKMKQDLRNSILGDPADPSIVSSAKPPTDTSAKGSPPESGRMSEYGFSCSMCNNTKACYHCNGTGKLWKQDCSQCSGSGKCSICLYS